MRFFLGKKAPNLNPLLATGTTSFCGQLFPSTFPLKLDTSFLFVYMHEFR